MPTQGVTHSTNLVEIPPEVLENQEERSKQDELRRLAEEVQAAAELQEYFGMQLATQQEELDTIEATLIKTEVETEQAKENLVAAADAKKKNRKAKIFAVVGGGVGTTLGMGVGTILMVVAPPLGASVVGTGVFSASVVLLSGAAGAAVGGVKGMLSK